MINALFFDNFAKRKNSTKQPNDNDGIPMQICLKGECSLVNPSFFISGDTKWTYIKVWDMYYFIDRIAYDINGAQYINCSLDVLASWKSEILMTSAFVKYSSTDYDVNIGDDRVPQKVTKTWDYSVTGSVFSTSGCYILATANENFGLVHYALTEEQLNLLMKELTGDSPFNWDKIKEVFSDVMGAIISVRYVPLSISSLDTDTTELQIGNWDGFQGGDVEMLNRTLYDTNFTLPIKWVYNDFRRSSTFTRFYLALPYVGCVPIAAENLIGGDNVIVRLVTDLATGTLAYSIYSTVSQYANSNLLATYSCSFGKQIPVAHDQVNIMGAVNGAVGMTGSATAMAVNGIENPLSYGGYGIAPMAMGTFVAAAVKTAVALNTHDFQVIGGYGGVSFEYLFQEIWLITVANDSKIEPSSLTTLYGRPCMKVRLLSGLTGYVETVGFAIDIRAVSEIRDLINSAMDRGIYIE